MNVDLEQVRKTFAKDLNQLAVGVKLAAEALLYGSYSARHPHLGKMVRCPYCRRRRRLNEAVSCCNPTYSKALPAVLPKSIIKRIMHKRHGQNRQWHIRQLIHLMQQDYELVKHCAEVMQVKAPSPHDVPSFAEKYWTWKQKHIVRAERRRANATKKQRRQHESMGRVSFPVH